MIRRWRYRGAAPAAERERTAAEAAADLASATVEGQLRQEVERLTVKLTHSALDLTLARQEAAYWRSRALPRPQPHPASPRHRWRTGFRPVDRAVDSVTEVWRR